MRIIGDHKEEDDMHSSILLFKGLQGIVFTLITDQRIDSTPSNNTLALDKAHEIANTR